MITKNNGSPSAAARGPSLLVHAFIFAADHLLLMRRGEPPYVGKWSTPGGFVESHESAENAVIREVSEEVGLRLPIEKLLPMATVSVECMNQVYIMFLVRLERLETLTPHAPEALDAKWYPRHAFPLRDIWEPFERFDMAALFDRVKRRRFEYYQRTDGFVRVISGAEEITYLRREPHQLGCA
jgi:ADP-ribose pyrophosphatase YjhB (NUDIX family)